MKKLLAIILTLTMALALTACTSDTETDLDTNVDTDIESDAETDVDDTETDPELDTDTDTSDDVEADVDTDIETDTTTDVTMESSLADIMNTVIETADVDDEVKEYIHTGLGQTEVTEDLEVMFLGTDTFVYEEAYAAEPMINAQAFSLVLVRTATEDEAVVIAEEIVTTVDPNKWICVGVDPSDVKAVAVGNTVLLVMSENADAYLTAFEAIA